MRFCWGHINPNLPLVLSMMNNAKVAAVLPLGENIFEGARASGEKKGLWCKR